MKRTLFIFLMVLTATLNAQDKDSAGAEESDRPFEVVEEMPEFPGGEAKMYEFISDHIRYPDSARDILMEARVVVRFVVNKDGKISDVKVIKGGMHGLGEEVLRVVNLMPAWKPGTQNGKPVSVYFTLPVLIDLE